jgi:aminotransferase
VSATLTSEISRTIGRPGSRALEDDVRARRESGQEILALRGGPSLPLPPHVREAAIAALDEPDRRPSRGLLELRVAICDALARETDAVLDPEREILVTNGAMHALNLILRAVLSPGDSVLIPAPAFYLDGAVRLAGAEPVYVPCSEEDGWRWDLDRIEAAITPRTRLLFACNPVNPTGFLPGREDLAALSALAERHGFLVLADESYDRFVYDGNRLTPILTVATYQPAEPVTPKPRLDDHIILVRSLSKSYTLASWRIGYIVGPPAIVDACTAVLEWEVLHCAYVGQRVATAAIAGPQDWLSGVTAGYQANRDVVYQVVCDSQWFTCARPGAGPFLFLNTERIEALGPIPPEQRLLDLGVPTVAGRHFQAPGYVRLPFGGDARTIDQLCAILRSFVPR